MSARPLKVYFVLGEESGDVLGADLFNALQVRAGGRDKDVEIVGLAGSKLQALGMNSLFDIHDIAVMGFTAVIGRLPTIVRRVYQTVADIVQQAPDVVVLIDSPDFTHAVAKRVRKKLPNTPIVNYVCPSVWAWRSGRAASMRHYVDHVLAILPFEPEALRKLNGPPATYIGHPLAQHIGSLNLKESPLPKSGKKRLLVLPGSRKSEIKRMLDIYGRTLTMLRERGIEFEAVIPAVPHLKSLLEHKTVAWPVRPVIVDSSDNDATFATAHAALATSGTVTLQLALHKVPTVAGYRIEPFTRPLLAALVNVWTILLPNLIVDYLLVPEEMNEAAKPERLARHLERLLRNSHQRKAQLDGFAEVIQLMETKRPPSELAAEVVLDQIKI